MLQLWVVAGAGSVRLCRAVIAPLDTERMMMTSGLPQWLSGEESAYTAGATGDSRSVPGGEDPLEEGEALHPSVVAWRMPRTEEPGGLHSMGSQRVGHD